MNESNIRKKKTACLNADLLQRVLQNDRVHYGRQHADVIRRRAIHVAGTGRHAAKNVSASDDYGNLNPELVSLLNLFSDRTRDVNVNAERLFAQQRLARELQQDATVSGGTLAGLHAHYDGWRSVPSASADGIIRVFHSCFSERLDPIR